LPEPKLLDLLSVRALQPPLVEAEAVLLVLQNAILERLVSMPRLLLFVNLMCNLGRLVVFIACAL